MLTRRSLFAALAAAPAALPALALSSASFDPDAPIMVNPWAEMRWGTGMVRPSEARLVEVVDTDSIAKASDRTGRHNWVIVHRHDGTKIDTEISEHQPEWMEIACKFKRAGVPCVDAFEKIKAQEGAQPFTYL